MKAFDKENVEVNAEDCFRWSRKWVQRMEELHSRNQLTKEEYEEYRMSVLCATLLDGIANDLQDALTTQIQIKAIDGLN